MNELKRIDFLGNANSYPMLIAQGMHKLGFDVHLHLLDDYYLNDPKNYYSEFIQEYPDWIHDWRPCNIPLAYDAKKLKMLHEGIEDADALVLNCGAVSLGYMQKRPYFCLLTGTDLLTYCDPNFLQHLHGSASGYPPKTLQEWHDFSCRISSLDFQREAIRESNGYSFFPRALQPAAKAILESIGADESRQHPLLVTDVDNLAFTVRRSAEVPVSLCILVSARCTWDRKTLPQFTDLDYKGTDVFLHGAVAALDRGVPLEIHMFRKGAHVQETESLVSDLNLFPHIHWHDEVPQSTFHEYIRRADVVVDNLGTSHIGMAAVDAFALGRPVVARMPDHTAWNFPEPFPVCHAQSPQEVADELFTLHSSPQAYAQKAITARKFAERFLSSTSAAQIVIDALQTPSPPRGYNLPIRARKELEDMYLLNLFHVDNASNQLSNAEASQSDPEKKKAQWSRLVSALSAKISRILQNR